MDKFRHYTIDRNILKSAGRLGIRISQHIGQGMFADVYRGIYRGKRVAIKVVDTSKLNQNTFKAELEVTKLLKDIKHENLVKFVNFWPDMAPRQAWFIMLYFEGQDMKEVLKKRGKAFRESTAKRYFWQMLDGLHCLHTNRIVHRDIKPANVLIGTHHKYLDVIKLIDFGFAKHVPKHPDKDEAHNAKAVCLSHKGSQIYMAPELMSDKYLQYDAFTTDIYSMGIVLYEMLFHDLPFLISDFGCDRNERQELMIQLKENLMFRYPVDIDVDESAKRIIEGMCCKDSDQRLNVQQIMQSPWFLTA